MILKHPSVVDPVADDAFQALARHTFPETHEWENRYVEHEMTRIHHVFQAGLCDVENSAVLEFGCNIGATAIVLAHAGAAVVGCDVSDDYLRLAQLNVRRYGFAHAVSLVRAADGGALPFRDGSFDTIVCNSVLEYLKASHLQRTLRELDRVLRSRGRLVVWGTSNRLFPVESHSRRWFVNYVPRVFDRLSGVRLPRGLWPWEIQTSLPLYEDVLHVRDSAYLSTRNAAAGRMRRGLLETGSYLCRRLGIHAEFSTPWLFAVLQKP